MAEFEITSPSGETFIITAPEGATEDQVMQYAKENFKTPEKAPEQPKWYEIEKQPGTPKGPKELVKQVGKQFLEGATSPMPGSLLTTPLKAVSETASQVGADVARATGSRLAGFGTAAALDPLTYAGGLAGAKVAGTVGAKTADVIGNQAAAIASGASNVPIKSIKSFFRNPMAVLKAPSSKEAGAVLQKAKELAGITREEEFLIAKAADRGTGGARTVAEELRPRFEGTVKDAIPLTIGELLAFNRAAGKLASEAKGSDKFLWSGVKAKVQKALESQATKLAEALEGYALSKTKDAFKSIVPLTKQGRADYLKMIGTGLTFGLTSPLAIGAGTLLAKGANTLLQPAAKASGFALGSIIGKSGTDALNRIQQRLKNAK